MKAVVLHGIGDIRLDEVPDPTIQDPTDAIVEITASAICGTDLHFVRGHHAGMSRGHDPRARGRGHRRGGRAAACATSAGRPGRHPVDHRLRHVLVLPRGLLRAVRQREPQRPGGGHRLLRRPADDRPLRRAAGENARIPFANVGPVKLPDEVTDDQAILLSDIFPTAYFGADLAEIDARATPCWCSAPGRSGQFAIASAVPAGRRPHPRASTASAAGSTWPARRAPRSSTSTPRTRSRSSSELTGGIGVDRVDRRGGRRRAARRSTARPRSRPRSRREQFEQERDQVAPEQNPDGDNWVPGDAPSQALQWAVEALAKAGTLGDHRRLPAARRRASRSARR